MRLARARPAAIALAVLLLAPARAAEPPVEAAFGSLVQAGDFDAVPGRLAELPQALVCFADRDQDGVLGAAEPILLRRDLCVDNRTVREGDLRLSGPGFGLRVGAGEPDLAAAVRPLTAWALGAVDADRDQRWSFGDALYLAPAGPAAAARAGHVRLTGWGGLHPGSVVAAGDPDAGAALAALPGLNLSEPERMRLWRGWDADGDGRLGAEDPLVLDLDGSGDLSPLDLRLTALGGLAAGALARPGEPGVLPRLGRFGLAPSLCFVDANASGDDEAGEPVYFKQDACPPPGPGTAGAPLAAGDLRVSGPLAGSTVRSNETDHGAPVFQLPGFGNVHYADLNHDGRWSEGDVLYLHMAVGRSTVTAGDLRLTPYGSFLGGTFVAPGDSDLKFLTTFAATEDAPFNPSPGRAWLLWDVLRDGAPDGDDVAYIDLDGDGEVGLRDVRLAPLAGRPFGSPVRPGDPDARPNLRPLPGAAVCFSDGNGNGLPDAGEPLYLQGRPCGPVQANDLRLSGASAGSKVRGRDPDANASTLRVPSLENVRAFDADGSGAWSARDTLYLHLATGGSAVHPGDLRLTAYGTRLAGTVVQASDGDLALPTMPLPSGAGPGALWGWWDLDRNGRFDGDDLIYVDADASGTVTVLDVRLAQMRRNDTSPASLVVQVPELQRTIETLEGFLARQAGELQALRAELEARNATLQQLQQEAASLRAENAQLQAQLAREREAEPPEAPRSAPGFELLLGAGAAGLAAGARGRRRR